MNYKIVFPKELPDTILTDKTEDGRPVWRLQKDYAVAINGHVLTVPDGLLFDYASVPRGLWNTFPPIDHRYCRAALVHDWLYAGEYIGRDIADAVFLEGMRLFGVPWWKRSVMYAAVRIGGGITYRKHTPASIAAVRTLSGIIDTRRPLWDTLHNLTTQPIRGERK